MRKKGFTLAEVLITLAIIGVVAALATPALNSSTQKAKVGPSIRKMMSTLENANEHILSDNESDSLNSIFGVETEDYLEALSKYAKGTIEDKTQKEITPTPTNIKGQAQEAPFSDNDLTYKIYTFAAGDAIAITLYPRENFAGGSYKGNIANFWYDMNGFDTKPNKAGKDEFLFRIDDNGSVYPDGGKTQKALQPNRAEDNLWWGNGRGSCNEKEVQFGLFCGASVVDNNYKVIYKY